MTKRGGILVFALAITLVAAATFVADGGDKPAELSCADEWGSIGFAEPTRTYPSPKEAAAAYVADLTIEGRSLSDEDVEFVDVTRTDRSIGSGRTIAARVEGKTVVLLGVSDSGDGTYSVTKDTSC